MSPSGAGPVALTLPDLEELGRFEARAPTTDVALDLPGLTALGSVSLSGVGAVTLDLPALATWTDDPVAPYREALSASSIGSLVVRAPAVTRASALRVWLTLGSTELDLPALRSLGGLSLAGLDGGLVLGLPALERVEAPVPTVMGASADVRLEDLGGVTALDILPSLALVEGAVSVTRNPDLVALNRLGADTLVGQTSGGYWGLMVTQNTELRTIDAFPAATFGGTVQISDNGWLPSCEAEALVLRLSGAFNTSCYRNQGDACSAVPGAVCR